MWLLLYHKAIDTITQNLIDRETFSFAEEKIYPFSAIVQLDVGASTYVDAFENKVRFVDSKLVHHCVEIKFRGFRASDIEIKRNFFIIVILWQGKQELGQFGCCTMLTAPLPSASIKDECETFGAEPRCRHEVG